MTHEDAAASFDPLRPRLTRIAYRMLGFVTLESDDVLQTTALEIEDGKIIRLYIMRNPDKLRHLTAADPDAH